MSNTRDAPSFFKVLVGDFRNKLCLPKAIRTKIGVNGKILLKNPITRRSWLVSVKEDENGMFLCNDWKNFANDNDLQFAEFVVFRSSGESEFNVKIFGKNGCEKDFPLGMEENTKETQSEESEFHDGTHRNTGEENKNEETILMNKMTNLGVRNSGNQVEQTGHSWIVTFKKSAKYNLYVARWWVELTPLGEKDRIQLLDPSDKLWSVDVIRKGAGDTFLGPGWSDFCAAYSLEIGDTIRLQFVDKNVMRIEIIQRKVNGTDISVEEANEIRQREKVKAMTGFVSDYPHCYIPMRPTYVGANFNLCVPATFARTFMKDDLGKVILRVPNGTSWSIHYAIQPKRYILGKGWRKFVFDNGLKVNDVCIFELVNRDPIEIKVSLLPITARDLGL